MHYAGSPLGRRCRAAFVNSGILGHRAVAGLLGDVAGRIPSLEAVHIDISRNLTEFERIVRRVLSLRAAPPSGPAANLDLRRWRQELNAGIVARRRLVRAERGGSFDLLHFHTQATAYASLRRMARTPAIVSIDATQHLAQREATSALSRASYLPSIGHDGLVFQAAAAIVATSEWAGRDLAAHYPQSSEQLHVLPYPVKPIAERSWIAEREEQGRTRPTHVMFMGGDFPRKGGYDLLSVWRDGNFAEKATLALVTDWPIREADLPLGVNLVWGIAPRTREWREAWRSADLFVMPTRQEAFGMVFQEAAAAGIPAVATRLAAVPEIVQDGSTGLLVPPGDRGALAHALRVLIESAALRRRMGEAAFDRAASLWSIDRYASRLAAVIDGVGEGRLQRLSLAAR